MHIALKETAETVYWLKLLTMSYYKEIPEHIKRFCDSRIDGSIKSVVKEFKQTYLIG